MQPLFNPVHIIGPIATLCDGYAFHNRGIIKALYKNNVPLKVTPLEPINPNAVLSKDPEIQKIITETENLPDPNIVISSCIPTVYNQKPGNINIGFTTWETDLLPTDWIHTMNRQSVILAPSNMLVELFKRNGIKVPVFNLGYPVPVIDKDSVLEVKVPDKSRVTFLFAGNWIPRKNIEDLIQSFCIAFENVTDVCLILKTWTTTNDNNSRSHIEKAVRHLADQTTITNRPRIHIITDQIEDQDMFKLINSCDIYVSASRGEGLDLTATIAYQLNKHLVLDEFLGHATFSGKKVHRFPSLFKPVIASGVGFHSPRMKWAQPSFYGLCQAMVNAYKSVKDSQNATVTNSIDSNHTEAGVVEKITTVINDLIFKSLPPIIKPPSELVL